MLQFIITDISYYSVVDNQMEYPTICYIYDIYYSLLSTHHVHWYVLLLGIKQ